jgi:hypothetical protein
MTPSITIVRTDRSEYLEQDLTLPLVDHVRLDNQAACSSGRSLETEIFSKYDHGRLAVEKIEKLGSEDAGAAQEGPGDQAFAGIATRLIRRR